MKNIALAAFSAAALLGLSACAEEPAEDTTIVETETAPMATDTMATDTMAADPAATDATVTDPAATDATVTDPAATETPAAGETAEPAM